MKNFTTLILGSCLSLQIVPLQTIRGGIDTDELTNLEAAFTIVPLDPATHARELIDVTEYPRTYGPNADALAMTQYIHQLTHDSLPEAWRPNARRIAQAIIDTANRNQMDPFFLLAVIKHESRFNPAALGKHGEIGLMQIKPSTAQWIMRKNGMHAESAETVAASLRDPASNVRIGASYLAYLRGKFKQNDKHALSAYNMGSGNLRSLLKQGISPKIYSSAVLAEYETIASSYEFGSLNVAGTSSGTGARSLVDSRLPASL